MPPAAPRRQIPGCTSTGAAASDRRDVDVDDEERGGQGAVTVTVTATITGLWGSGSGSGSGSGQPPATTPALSPGLHRKSRAAAGNWRSSWSACPAQFTSENRGERKLPRFLSESASVGSASARSARERPPPHPPARPGPCRRVTTLCCLRADERRRAGPVRRRRRVSDPLPKSRYNPSPTRGSARSGLQASSDVVAYVLRPVHGNVADVLE